jgi:hypothetical protein
MISDMNKKIVGILVFIIVIIIELLRSRDGSGLTCPNDKLYNSRDGRCYECLSSADCSSGKYCDRGACVTTESTEFGCTYTDEDGECVRCETNRDCLLGQDCIDGNCEQIGNFGCHQLLFDSVFDNQPFSSYDLKFCDHDTSLVGTFTARRNIRNRSRYHTQIIPNVQFNKLIYNVNIFYGLNQVRQGQIQLEKSQSGTIFFRVLTDLNEGDRVRITGNGLPI